MSTNYQILGEKVRKYRKAKNYSTSEFAERLDVSAGLINNIENARNDVFKLELLTRIMNELDVSLGELIQLKTIDIRNINMQEKGKLSLYENNEDSSEIIELINDHINLIIRSFLTTISEYSCTQENVKTIGGHILQELDMLIKLHKLNSKIPG